MSRHRLTPRAAALLLTLPLGRWDHVFVRGFDVPVDPPTGVSGGSRIASDHRAVWAVLPTRGGRRRP